MFQVGTPALTTNGDARANGAIVRVAARWWGVYVRVASSGRGSGTSEG